MMMKFGLPQKLTSLATAAYLTTGCVGNIGENFAKKAENTKWQELSQVICQHKPVNPKIIDPKDTFHLSQENWTVSHNDVGKTRQDITRRTSALINVKRTPNGEDGDTQIDGLTNELTLWQSYQETPYRSDAIFAHNDQEVLTPFKRPHLYNFCEGYGSKRALNNDVTIARIEDPKNAEEAKNIYTKTTNYDASKQFGKLAKEGQFLSTADDIKGRSILFDLSLADDRMTEAIQKLGVPVKAPVK
jgi:hypothetical protein